MTGARAADRWRLSAVAAMAVLLLALSAVAGAPARAVGLDDSCRIDLGTRLPVVLVHGWNSSQAAWADEAAKLKGPKVAAVTFDYSQQHTNWVADPNIGPALAREIICLATNSLLTGGPGKVVVVGHSMGGLAIRCALQVSCSRVPGARMFVAQVITVGTPTQGSFWRTGRMVGNLGRLVLDQLCEVIRTVVNPTPISSDPDQQNNCQAYLTNAAAVAFDNNSAELKALRADSTDVPVLALAGEIKVNLKVLFAQVTIADGDAVVTAQSQQAWSTEKADVDCGHLSLQVIGFGYTQATRSDVSYKCWHGAETTDQDVEKQISARVATLATRLAPNPDRRLVRFGGIGELTLGMTVGELQEAGFTDEGNIYDDDACHFWDRSGFPIGASVDTAAGRVIALKPADTLSPVTAVGQIGVGSSLAQIRAAFAGPGYSLEEHFGGDFGQGSNGIIVNGPGGSIGLGLDGDAAHLSNGAATVDYLAGVGVPGQAPSMMETGC